MSYKHCNREYLYRSYDFINSLILRLEREAEGIPFREFDDDYEEWRKNTLKRRTFDERVYDVRKTTQAIMDVIRASEDITDWNKRERWLDRIKFFFKGCYRERKKYLLDMFVMFTDIAGRLDALDGGVDNNDAQKYESLPANDKLAYKTVGFTGNVFS